MSLGAGRNKAGDEIDYKAGVLLSKKVGDKVIIGETLATLYSSNANLLDKSAKIFKESVEISDKKPTPNKKVVKTV